MSSSRSEHHSGETDPDARDALSRVKTGLPVREPALGPAGKSSAPAIGSAPIPTWLVGVIGLEVFWAGAYLFSFSGGFKADVFDFEPKFGVVGGAQAAVDPKVVGKALFSANCITCHQANGQGIPGQYPPLAGSEIVLGEATNHAIAIVLKGLQGPLTVKGQTFNNAMQPWEGQYTDQQLAAILTYVRSDWGNNAPPVTADMVKQIREEIKDRKEQWTWPELQKMAAKNLTAPAAGGSPPPGQPRPANSEPQNQSAPPPAAPVQPPAKGSM